MKKYKVQYEKTSVGTWFVKCSTMGEALESISRTVNDDETKVTITRILRPKRTN